MIKEQQVEQQGIFLTNFVIEKQNLPTLKTTAPMSTFDV